MNSSPSVPIENILGVKHGSSAIYKDNDDIVVDYRNLGNNTLGYEFSLTNAGIEFRSDLANVLVTRRFRECVSHICYNYKFKQWCVAFDEVRNKCRWYHYFITKKHEIIEFCKTSRFKLRYNIKYVFAQRVFLKLYKKIQEKKRKEDLEEWISLEPCSET